MIRNFTPRLYQQTILGTTVYHNTLVVLPTGLGKTALAFLLAAQRLTNYPKHKILMVAPTKPLCEQHVQTFQTHLQIPKENIALFTGSVKPDKRAELWNNSQVIISTPQGLENDVINKRVKLEEVSLLIFDEAHHATGEYSYVWLAHHYEKVSKYSRILALTASPGSDMDKIREVCQNLHVEKIEVRTEKDPDVKPYIKTIKKNWVEVPFPEEFKKIQKHLELSRKAKLIEVLRLGCTNKTDLNKTQILMLQRELQKKISSGQKDFETLKSLSLLAEALKVDHALELLETQGLQSLQQYLHKLQQQSQTTSIKAVKNLMIDPNFKAGIYLTDDLVQNNVIHPKIKKLQEIIQERVDQDPTTKIIIFTQYRSSAEKIIESLEKEDIKNHIFVGQAKKNGIGFSQKKQKEVLDQFRNGNFNILVATSVAEEGLDIPKVDKVLFYEPVPSAVRSIQRRGRTGRLEQGEVTILVTKGTRDVGYRWSSHHKEKRMYRNLEALKTKASLLTPQKPVNTTLSQFIQKDEVVAVLADHREKDNRTVKELIELGVSVQTKQLVSADYVVSGRVGVELKKVPDFVSSIIDGRILGQVKDLKHNFPKSVLIIEGDEDIYSVRKIHANAIRGMLSTISLDFNVPIIYTKNPKDTAALLAVMAKREQNKEATYVSHQQKPKSFTQQQEYIIAAIPNLGMTHAKKLLTHFGSIKAVANASIKEMMEIEGIGKKTAERIKEIVEKEYSPK